MLAEAYVCLALNMYHEARGEGPVGMVAVGQTTINRAAAGDKRWPSDICKVVKQMRQPAQCQFSWYCDSVSDKPRDKDAWNLSMALAIGVMDGSLSNPRLSKSTCYHATWIKRLPPWVRQSKFLTQVGDHKFYAC